MAKRLDPTAVFEEALAGCSFSGPNLKSGEAVRFVVPKQPDGWPRSGSEGYVLVVECHHPERGKIPSVLKSFTEYNSARDERTRFLVESGLARGHSWLFKGVPYAAVNEIVNGYEVDGHVAGQIVGHVGGDSADDISILRENGRWSFVRHVRRQLAGQLCCAVHCLERFGMVHGDLQPKNVIIGSDDDGRPAAMLCDFDSFRHQRAVGVMTSGCAGYQYPSLVEALDKGDPDRAAETDRFALGVLLCEIMAWSDADFERRESMLTTDAIRQRRFGDVPTRVVARWPKGFALLDKALKAATLKGMPGPRDWMEALEVTLDPRPVIEVRYGFGDAADFVGQVRLSSSQGNLGKLDERLAPVDFKVDGVGVILSFKWTDPLFVVRDGRVDDRGGGPHRVTTRRGDRVVSSGWHFVMLDDTVLG